MKSLKLKRFVDAYADRCRDHDVIPEELFDTYGVKRGLRDKNGNGVVTGLTNISRIDAFKMVDGKKSLATVNSGTADTIFTIWSEESTDAGSAMKKSPTCSFSENFLPKKTLTFL